jgi:hypothetical protein
MKTRVIQDDPNPVEPERPADPTRPPDAGAGGDGPPAARQGPRVLPLVFGIIAVLLALALLASGVAGAVALAKRDDSGFFMTGRHSIKTSSHALVTQSLDVAGVPGWLTDDRLATVRVQGSSSRPAFIGIARSAAVTRYMAGVRHAEITDIDTDPFVVRSHLVGGGAQPAAPATRDFWRVQASGAGTQTVTWPLENGKWSVVAMNADGSSGVNLTARFGAKVPALRWVTIGLLIAGGILLAIGGGLLYIALRKRAGSPAAGLT